MGLRCIPVLDDLNTYGKTDSDLASADFGPGDSHSLCFRRRCLVLRVRLSKSCRRHWQVRESACVNMQVLTMRTCASLELLGVFGGHGGDVARAASIVPVGTALGLVCSSANLKS